MCAGTKSECFQFSKLNIFSKCLINAKFCENTKPKMTENWFPLFLKIPWYPHNYFWTAQWLLKSKSCHQFQCEQKKVIVKEDPEIQVVQMKSALLRSFFSLTITFANEKTSHSVLHENRGQDEGEMLSPEFSLSKIRCLLNIRHWHNRLFLWLQTSSSDCTYWVRTANLRFPNK